MFKYVIFEDGNYVPHIVIFDVMTNHSTVRNQTPEYFNTVSAGKLYLQDNKQFLCVNGSTTLNISFTKDQSDKDSDTINKLYKMGSNF